jgi:hypothetical protein
MAARISITKAANKERIERCAGDNAELTEFGDHVGQTPVRDAYTHAALNDFWKLHHLWILSQIWIFADLFFETTATKGPKCDQFCTE